MTPAQFWAIEMQNQQNQQENMQQMTNQAFSAMGQLAGQYAENKAMGVKAKSYDKIADILGSSMFSENKDAMQAFADLRAAEDPREKVMGYEQLFSMLGPMSNMMMAQNRLGVQQQGQMMNSPGARAAIGNQVDDAAGRTTYSPPAGLGSVVPAPTPAGFGSINQGMPGAMPMTQVNPSRRPMATRPGGR
jgi:hypothetical protein